MRSFYIKLPFTILIISVLLSCKNQKKSESYSQPESSVDSTLRDTTRISKAPTWLDSIPIIVKSDNSKKEEIKEVVKKSSLPKKKRKLPKITFDSLVFYFDTIESGDIVSHKFNFKNTGLAPLSIKKAEVSCGCTIPSYPFLDIEPGSDGFIGVTYNSLGKKREQKAEVKVFTNTKDSPITLYVSGYVKSKEE